MNTFETLKLFQKFSFYRYTICEQRNSTYKHVQVRIKCKPHVSNYVYYVDYITRRLYI